MKKLKVLIVDDSREDAKRAADFLGKAGHEIIFAQDGAEGVEAARRFLPDLILMDVVMPGMNGFQATRQLCGDAATRHIPVIVVSGKDQETDKVWALRQGARAYITKIVQRDTLFKTIETVMA